MCTDAFQSRRVQKSIQTYGCIWPEAIDGFEFPDAYYVHILV